MRSPLRGFGRARPKINGNGVEPTGLASRPPRVIFAFAIYTAVAVLVVAAFVVTIVRKNIVQNAKDNVTLHANFVARSVIPNELTVNDWRSPLTGTRLDKIDAAMNTHVLTGQTKRIKLYSPSGHVIYSNVRSLIGERNLNGAELKSVLNGKNVTGISRLNAEGGPGPNPKVLETYAPVYFHQSSRPVGVLELYSDYDTAAGAVRKQAAPLTIALLLALLGLYVALLPILRRTTRALSYSNAELRRRADDLHINLVKRAEIEDRLRDTIKELERSESLLAISQEETIMRLSMAVESRHAETGSHIERMGRYSALVARKLGWDEERCELLRIASPLHDVGKIAIADSVLQKPGSLTPDERQEMQKHAEIGHNILAGSDSELLDLAARIALTHHEHWDGAGYPHGLSGDAIPIEGRIAAVADVFDALTSDRVYRAAYPIEQALGIMEEGRGAHFDPLVLDVFFESIDEVLSIREGKLDEDQERERERRRRGRRRRLGTRAASIPDSPASDKERAVIALPGPAVDTADNAAGDDGDVRRSLVG